jgi:hypothetical protein
VRSVAPAAVTCDAMNEKARHYFINVCLKAEKLSYIIWISHQQPEND